MANIPLIVYDSILSYNSYFIPRILLLFLDEIN